MAEGMSTADWYRTLGPSGLSVSPIGLGMMSFGDPALQAWALDEDRAAPIVRAAVEGGITFFDTADMYSDGESERITGALLRRLFASREEYVLATKVYWPTGESPNERGLSRKHVMAAIDASLRRLGTDYVDLYQVHRWDEDTPIEETMAALDEVVRAGKTRYIGASTMSAWQFAKAQHAAERAGQTRFIAMQDRYNLVNREEEREMIPLCLDQGVGLVPYSPLARGLLAGKRAQTRSTARSSADRREYRDTDLTIAETVKTIAEERGVSPAQIALAWLLGRPGVVAPIVGATRLEHVTDAIAAAALELTDEECRRLEEPYVPHRARRVHLTTSRCSAAERRAPEGGSMCVRHASCVDGRRIQEPWRRTHAPHAYPRQASSRRVRCRGMHARADRAQMPPASRRRASSESASQVLTGATLGTSPSYSPTDVERARSAGAGLSALVSGRDRQGAAGRERAGARDDGHPPVGLCDLGAPPGGDRSSASRPRARATRTSRC